MTENKPTVLVVEDEPQMLKFLRIALDSHGYRVLDAKTGKEAIQQATAYTPDIVILDLGLPDMDGLEVTKRIREWSAVPIIIVSARGQEDSKVQALDQGADDYLTKPFGAAELLARVRYASVERPGWRRVAVLVVAMGIVAAGVVWWRNSPSGRGGDDFLRLLPPFGDA